MRVWPSKSVGTGRERVPPSDEPSCHDATWTLRSVTRRLMNHRPPCHSLRAISPICASSTTVTGRWNFRCGTPVGKMCCRCGPRGRSSSSGRSSSRLAASSKERSSGPCTTALLPPPLPGFACNKTNSFCGWTTDTQWGATFSSFRKNSNRSTDWLDRIFPQLTGVIRASEFVGVTPREYTIPHRHRCGLVHRTVDVPVKSRLCVYCVRRLRSV